MVGATVEGGTPPRQVRVVDSLLHSVDSLEARITPKMSLRPGCNVCAQPHGAYTFFFFAICTCFCSCSISQPRRPPEAQCRRPCLLTWTPALSVRRRTMPTVSEKSPRCLRPRVSLVSYSVCLSVTASKLNLKRSSPSYFSD
jgi:hypothetical protein